MRYEHEVIRLINIQQKKYLIVLKCKLYFIDITIVDQSFNTFKGEIKEDGFKTLSSKLKQELNEYWTNTLNLFKSKETDRNDLDIQYNKDESQITFKWKKVSENSLIKQQLGSIELKKETIEDKFTVFDVLFDVFLRQEELNNELKSQNSCLLNDCQRNKQNLDVLISKTSDLKKNLLSKFSSVLNAKKEKIRELIQEAGPSPHKTKPDSKSERHTERVSIEGESTSGDDVLHPSPKNEKKSKNVTKNKKHALKKSTSKPVKAPKRKNSPTKPLTVSDLETESENEEIKADRIIEDVLKKKEGNKKEKDDNEENTIELSERSKQQTEVKLTRLRKRKSDTESSMIQAYSSEEKKSKKPNKKRKTFNKKDDNVKSSASCDQKDEVQKEQKWVSVDKNEDLFDMS